MIARFFVTALALGSVFALHPLQGQESQAGRYREQLKSADPVLRPGAVKQLEALGTAAKGETTVVVKAM